MKRSINILLITALIICCPTFTLAQRKASKVKASPVVNAAQATENMNFENLLPSTAKVQFIDSSVVALDAMYGAIPISKGMGRIYAEPHDSLIDYIYENELGSKRIIAKSTGEKNSHKLYSSTKLARSWSEPTPINISGDFSDIICPFLMPDGQTLYFAAKGGEDNVGGYDIFFTVYNTDDGQFITPQSAGLPFNSHSHDFYYIVDENNNLGFLVTQRKMTKGNVCVYTFIPTESRETYTQDENFDQSRLKSLASLSSIKDTQTNPQEVADALSRLSKAKSNTDSSNDSSIHFELNSKITYYSLDQFKSPANKIAYKKLLQKKQSLHSSEERLSELRKAYHNGDRKHQAEIMQLENTIQADRITINNAEAEIRSSELKQLTSK